MTGVALLNATMKLSRNQNDESNCGLPLNPSLTSPTSVNKAGYITDLL